ncbi:MAG: T9SS type A sorting domain-containing protein, partial [Bacteroidetes bacterium]|nr:T9SS type A sorting domain-containing protein [Bacteroidota bacterium]
GRVVSSGTCSNSTIDISALNKGIYIISFHSAQGLIHGRIVKM